MPGSLGTGVPLHFKCAKCRSMNWVSDGVRKKSERRGPQPRIDQDFKYLYQCMDCKHIGWSRHKDVAMKWKSLYATSSSKRSDD